MKAIKNWPVRGGIVKIPGYTFQQRRWMLRIYNLGGRVGVVLGVGKEVFWLDGLVGVKLGYYNREEIEFNATTQGISSFLTYVKGVA